MRKTSMCIEKVDGLIQSYIIKIKGIQMCDLNNTIPFISPCWYKESPLWAFGDAMVTIFSALIILFGTFKYWSIIKNWWKVWRYPKDNCIIVFGLGENNRTYIDSQIKDTKILVVEQNKDNLYIQNYFGKIAIKIADASNNNVLESLNLQDKKHIVVSLGNDMLNLEVVTQILSLNPKVDTKIYVHIEDRNLRHFHKEGGLLEGSNINIYSYYADTSRAIFENYDIDGKDNKVINSNVPYSIAVVGNTNLAYEVISQACIMGQLPNENKLTIFCIDKNPEEFKQSVDLNFTEIDNVPNVELKYIQLDYNSKKFYQQNLWYTQNLTNIILCFENEQCNLDIAANLANITYMDDIADDKLKTAVLIGMFNDYHFSKKLKENFKYFKNFFVFGQRSEICDKKYLIDELRDSRAKATNEIYNETVSEEKKKSWLERLYYEKESNRASADHIKIKQKYLEIDSSDRLIELLAKCEHNRWNAFHFLNGWNYNIETNKAKKLHNCLVSYDELSEDIKGYDREMVDNIDKIMNWKKNEK